MTKGKDRGKGGMRGEGGVRMMGRDKGEVVSFPAPPSSHKEKGSGVTSQNPWTSFRSLEQPIKLQSGVYQNAEVRTSTSMVPLKAYYEIHYSTLSNL